MIYAAFESFTASVIKLDNYKSIDHRLNSLTFNQFAQ
jgi:hypothetical protein